MVAIENVAVAAFMAAVTFVVASAVAVTVATRAVEVIAGRAAITAAEPAVVPAAGRAVALISTQPNSLVGSFSFDLP